MVRFCTPAGHQRQPGLVWCHVCQIHDRIESSLEVKKQLNGTTDLEHGHLRMTVKHCRPL